MRSARGDRSDFRVGTGAKTGVGGLRVEGAAAKSVVVSAETAETVGGRFNGVSERIRVVGRGAEIAERIRIVGRGGSVERGEIARIVVAVFGEEGVVFGGDFDRLRNASDSATP